MRAFYSTQGEALLARSLPCDPESYDVDAPAVCEVTVSVLLAAMRFVPRKCRVIDVDGVVVEEARGA